MLELKNISVTRDNRQILKNVSLSLPSNKFIAITGPNGSGKSTIAKIIMGIYQPDEGSIIFNGKDITDASITERAKMGIGFAFQQPVVFKGLSVFDMISLAAGKKVNLDAACEYLSEVGLCAKDYINREMNSKLSGGELKRIELAMLVAKNSAFTIFDEPEAGIDLWSFNSLISIFKKMQENESASVVVISHQERILDIADEVILLVEGKVVDSGERDKIFPKLLTLNSCELTTKRC